MDTLSHLRNNIINPAASELCEELNKLKQSYFTSAGKEGWVPLTAATLKYKKYKFPNNVTNFNMQTGELLKSLKVYWDYTSEGIKITVEFTHDAHIPYLTKTLGRDFLTTDPKEAEFIKTRFVELIKKYATAGR